MSRILTKHPETRPARSADVDPGYGELLCRLSWPGDADTAPLLLGVTSCTSGEGVSTVASSLAAAAAAANQDRDVLLVEACGSAKTSAGLGWSDVLQGDASLSEALRPLAEPNLYLLPAGRPESGGSPSASRRREIVELLQDEFALVVFDLPPLAQPHLVVPQAMLLTGIILVIESERLPGELIRREKELLVAANVRILGAVLNKQRQYLPHWLTRLL